MVSTKQAWLCMAPISVLWSLFNKHHHFPVSVINHTAILCSATQPRAIPGLCQATLNHFWSLSIVPSNLEQFLVSVKQHFWFLIKMPGMRIRKLKIHRLISMLRLSYESYLYKICSQVTVGNC
jgi:hypothetical protein